MAKYYAIKVDYFVYDETKPNGIGREPKYLYTMRNKYKVYVFKSELTAENLDLKWFETREEAEEYIVGHGMTKSLCYDNARVEEIEYEP